MARIPKITTGTPFMAVPVVIHLNHSDGRYDLSPLLSSRSERMWYPVVRRSAPRTRIRNGLEVWPVLWSGSKGLSDGSYPDFYIRILVSLVEIYSALLS